MKTFKVVLQILIIGVISSMVPFGYFGVMLGFPSVLLNTLLLSLLFKKQLFSEIE